MSDNPSSAPVLRSQYNFMQSTKALGGLDHELRSNVHQPVAIDSAGLEPTVTYVNPLPPTTYTRNVVYDNPAYDAHLAIGPAEQQGNPSQYQADGYTGPPGITQSVPIAPGPPRLEPYAPVIPEIPNYHPPGHMPLTHVVTGPSQGNPSLNLVNSGMSAGENLKDLASRYLHNAGSHVNDLRMRRSRSGAVKVLILLEIDDTV